jgi:uncharacterized protein (TIGR02217 family)
LCGFFLAMSISFAEVVLDTGFRPLGIKGGSGYNTNIVVVNSGFESRNKNWENSRGKWEYGERKVTSTELHSLEGFFRLRNGKFQGFRLRDYANYTASHEPTTEYNVVSQGVLIKLTDTTAQLYKKIWDISTTLSDTFELRKIGKPIIGEVPTVYKNGTELTHIADWEVDQGHGIVTFTSSILDADVLTADVIFDTAVRFDSDEFSAQLIAGVPDDTDGFSETYYQLFSLPIIEIRT